MRKLLAGLGLLFTGLAIIVLGAAPSQAAPRKPAPARALKPFVSDAQLRTFLKNRPARPSPEGNDDDDAANIVVTGVKAVSITNTQEAGVDEGGIVKQRGDILIVLRRGRLFTVSIAGGKMVPVDRINAFPPGVTGEGDWYDEMVLSGNRVIVVGYSYDRGGIEINRFRIDDAGHLRFEDAYQLKSNDYYSSSNYASRLIGDTLIFYTPLDLEWSDDPLEALPGMRRWRGDEDAPFKRIVRANQVFIPPTLRDGKDAEIDTLHTLTTCSLAAAEMQCRAVGVLGTRSRSFYVSPTAMYLWISDAWHHSALRRGARGFLYRLPLGRTAPTAIGVRGSPVDQFSFQERAGRLNVLVRANGGSDGMWSSRVSEGDVALARIPIGLMGEGSSELPLASYRALPAVENYWAFRNRFVGDALLYGAPADEDEKQILHVVPVNGGRIANLTLAQSISRIDLMGRDGIVVGGTKDDGLGFTTIDLTPGAMARVGGQFILPKAGEAESRSQAFFFSPDPRTPGGANGTVGLPVQRRNTVDDSDSAAIVFLGRHARRLSDAGALASGNKDGTDDGCAASCTDWYGNMRPIFTGGRIFALMGYELVEGRMRGDRIAEVTRVDFARPTRPR